MLITAGWPARILELMEDIRIPPTNLVFSIGLSFRVQSSWNFIDCQVEVFINIVLDIISAIYLLSFDIPTILNHGWRNKTIRRSTDVSSTIQAIECWISGNSGRSWFVELYTSHSEDRIYKLLQTKCQETIFQLRVNDLEIPKAMFGMPVQQGIDAFH